MLTCSASLRHHLGHKNTKKRVKEASDFRKISLRGRGLDKFWSTGLAGPLEGASKSLVFVYHFDKPCV